jgi:hypothetical protein
MKTILRILAILPYIPMALFIMIEGARDEERKRAYEAGER